MEFSVIVPALNEENYIEDCLRAISSQTFPRYKYEIIVSDGTSTDKTVVIAKKYADRLIVSKKKGICWGRNYGAKFAQGKYLVFIDADTRLKEDYLEIVHKYLESGVVGLTMGFEIEHEGPTIRMLVYISSCYWWLNSKIGNRRLIGINLCTPKDVFMEVGGFKEFALEDAALDKELRKCGKTLFLSQRKVVTSARRLEAYGVIGICRYYFELGLPDSGKIKKPYMMRFIKYRQYMPIRKPEIKRMSSVQRSLDALRNALKV